MKQNVVQVPQKTTNLSSSRYAVETIPQKEGKLGYHGIPLRSDRYLFFLSCYDVSPSKESAKERVWEHMDWEVVESFPPHCMLKLSLSHTHNLMKSNSSNEIESLN